MLKGRGRCMARGVGGAVIILQMEKGNATHIRLSSRGFRRHKETFSTQSESAAKKKGGKNDAENRN